MDELMLTQEPTDAPELENGAAPAVETPAEPAAEAPVQEPAAEAPAEEPAAEAAPAEPQLVEVVDIQFRPGQKVYFFDPDGLTIQPEDHVIMDTARGLEFGYCTGGNHRVRESQVVAPLRKIIRIATAEDDRIAAENRQKEARAYEICLKKIADLGLDMQLVSAEYAFDGTKIVFYFTADERVDFRELVKNLAGTFHVRIELRQIGVRDKAKMVGGLGICGRPFCCASFLSEFQPVSIKMAKTQNLSLNPTKISGTCGRLMCCLKYEQEAYEDLLRTSPKMDSLVDTPDGRGTVVEVNLLGQKVRVRLQDSPETINTYLNTDIAVLRNGKGKKTDPPIPDDLAPISGSGVKRERKPVQPKEETPMLDPVKFRYREDNVVEERTPMATEDKEPPRPRRPRRPRTEEDKRPPKPRTDAPKTKSDEQKPSKAKSDDRRPPKARTDEQRPPRPRTDEQRPPKSKAEAPKAKPDEQANGQNPEQPKEHRESRGHRPNKPRQPRPNRPGDQIKTLDQNQRPKLPKAEKPGAPAPESGEASGQQHKPHRTGRRPNYHRSHKPQNGGEGKAE